MPIYTKVSGAWKELSAVYVKVSGAWKSCRQVYVKVSGVWKPCWLTTNTVSNSAIACASPQPAFTDCTISLSNVKVGSTITLSGVEWMDFDNAGTFFAVRLTNATPKSSYHHENSGQYVYHPADYDRNVPFTHTYTATGTNVTIVLLGRNRESQTVSCNVSYTQEGYFD